MKPKRNILRLVCREEGEVVDIIEQAIPITNHAIYLALRRKAFRCRIANALLENKTITLDMRAK